MEADGSTQEVEVNEAEDDEVRDERQEEGGEIEGEEDGEVEDEEDEAGNPLDEDQPTEDAAPSKEKRERKETVPLKREPGKSLLPFSRVQKIIKADKVGSVLEESSGDS